MRTLQIHYEYNYKHKLLYCLLLNYYRRIVSQVESESGLKDSLKISIIAGIMICDELCKEKQKLQYTNQTINRQDLDEAEKITLRMIDNLNKVTK